MRESKESVTQGPLAITAFVCGLTGCALGVTPFLAIQATVLGAAGVLLGFISRKQPPPLRGIQSRLALSAIILGCLAVGLALLEFVMVN